MYNSRRERVIKVDERIVQEINCCNSLQDYLKLVKYYGVTLRDNFSLQKAYGIVDDFAFNDYLLGICNWIDDDRDDASKGAFENLLHTAKKGLNATEYSLLKSGTKTLLDHCLADDESFYIWLKFKFKDGEGYVAKAIREIGAENLTVGSVKEKAVCTPLFSWSMPEFDNYSLKDYFTWFSGFGLLLASNYNKKEEIKSSFVEYREKIFKVIKSKNLYGVRGGIGVLGIAILSAREGLSGRDYFIFTSAVQEYLENITEPTEIFEAWLTDVYKNVEDLVNNTSTGRVHC